MQNNTNSAEAPCSAGSEKRTPFDWFCSMGQHEIDKERGITLSVKGDDEEIATKTISINQVVLLKEMCEKAIKRHAALI